VEEEVVIIVTRRVAGEETVTHKTFKGPDAIDRAQKWINKQEKKQD
jgi:hypothetical protein